MNKIFKNNMKSYRIIIATFNIINTLVEKL